MKINFMRMRSTVLTVKLSVLALMLLITPIAFAAQGKHALLVGISRYPVASGAAQLDGVLIDLKSARRMAHAMGVDDASIVELRNTDATKSNIQNKLEQLSRKVLEGDRVFVYFSGHGTRFQTETGCEEGFYTYDDEVINHQDLAKYTGPMSQRAEKLITMIDACFSGGVVAKGTRSLASPRGLVAKFTARTTEDMCSTDGVNNTKTRSLLTELGRFGIKSENFVEIAAAKPNEVSWEITGEGGLATQAVSRCLLGEARDLNGSGAVSLDEVRACAQKIVNDKMAPLVSGGQSPSTIQVTGNRNLIVTPTVAYKPPLPTVAAVTPTPLATIVQNALTPKPPPKPEPTIAVTPPANVPPATVVQNPPTPKPPSQATPNMPVVPITPVVSTPPVTQTVVVSPPPQPVIKPPVSAPPVSSPVATQTQEAIKPPPKPLTAPVAVALPIEPAAESMPVVEVNGALATMQEIYQQRDPRRALTVKAAQDELRIGRDKLALTVTSANEGYVYAVMLGSDEKSFYLLFPNKIDQDNRIKAKQALQLPRPGWEVGAGGPAGTNKVLVVVSQSPRDAKVFVPGNELAGGVFTYSVADLQSRGRLIDFFVGKGVKGRSTSMSAALMDIKEIQ